MVLKYFHDFIKFQIIGGQYKTDGSIIDWIKKMELQAWYAKFTKSLMIK